MNTNDVISMFNGISDNSKEVIARRLKNELKDVIISLNEFMVREKMIKEQLTPPPELIFNAFRLCDLNNTKVVLLGQDPYINPGEAMGLSFSVPKGKKIPPSLRNIYNCLLEQGFIKQMPEHGDLTNWAKQGILLLNAALTTRIKKSYAHANIWVKYTDALIRELSAMPRQLIFILLGNFAAEKKTLIDNTKHIVLEWGHPSPLNNANKSDDNPKNFKYCNVFTRTNEILLSRGEAPINWDPDNNPPVIEAPKKDISVTNTSLILRESGSNDPAPLTASTLWLFTDGGSSGNGKEHCKASWAFYITDGCNVVESYGGVEEKQIPGEIFKSSNNRGELSALLNGLDFISRNLSKFEFDSIIVVSDSEYSINCLDSWAEKWLANPAKYKLSEKKNLDLIVPAKEALDDIRAKFILTFKHVNSHRSEPNDTEGEEWFIWKCNDIVDKLCNKALGRC